MFLSLAFSIGVGDCCNKVEDVFVGDFVKAVLGVARSFSQDTRL